MNQGCMIKFSQSVLSMLPEHACTSVVYFYTFLHNVGWVVYFTATILLRHVHSLSRFLNLLITMEHWIRPP